MIDLREVNRDQFERAKKYLAVAMCGKIAALGLGSWGVFMGPASVYLPQVVLLFAVGAAVVEVFSEQLKARAEKVLRTLDICRSLGRTISKAEMRDIVSAVPRATRARFTTEEVSDDYFASTAPLGPRKAVEHLQESAWYTRKQTGVLAAMYTVVIVVLLGLSVIALIVSMRELSAPEAQEDVVRIVTAGLMLIVTLDMIRGAWAYFDLHRRAGKTEEACEHLLTGKITEEDALREWCEYHVARSSAPLLPGWLWRTMGPSLVDAWRRADEA